MSPGAGVVTAGTAVVHRAAGGRAGHRRPTRVDVLRYGGLGLPLAFVALPLVVQWPAYAAAQWGLPLAVLGTLLLAVRVADALVDPWIGRRADGWFSRSASAPWRALAGAAVLLLAGFVALFFAPAGVRDAGPGHAALLAWSAAAMVMTYLGYSIAQVVHQAWAARLGGDEVERSRWVGAREAFSLVGVLAASVLPTLAGWPATAVALGLLLAAGLWALAGLRTSSLADGPPAERSGPDPAPVPLPPATGSPPGPAASAARAETGPSGTAHRCESPWSARPFRSLLAVYTLNGLAASIPASLVLFFVRDRVQAPAVFEALFLAAYFGAAALAVPLWVRAVARLGLVRSWALGMAASIAAFVGAVTVGPGETTTFVLICIASGFALGADLVAPPALLAGVIQGAGVHGRSEGRWFGWWSMATKLTLALAAGVALPLVEALGYQTGSREPQALQALAVVYAVVPCAIKALALALLWRFRLDWNTAAAAEAPAAGAAMPPSPRTSR